MPPTSTFRRAIVWAMLALYGLVASGLPLPFGPPPASSAAAKKIAGKDRSTPFPCMDKACGCDTAERCFSSCCCLTPAETLVWAEACDIEPAVIDALARRVAGAAEAPGPSGSCCEKAAPAREPSCCLADGDNPDEAICSDYQSLATDPKPSPPGPACEKAVADPIAQKVASVTGVVVLRDMLACSGIASWWSAVGVSLPPPSSVTCDLAEPQVDIVLVHDLRILGSGSPPEIPPPRGC